MPVHLPEGTHVRDLSTRELGQLGEDLAAAHLQRIGWRILERNVRTARGELDIIALEDRTLVFVEVKTRRTFVTGIPQAAVTAAKVSRLRRLAGEYLLHSAPSHRDVRIDVVAVLAAQGGCTLEHLRSVS